jgi:hypothetical protein
LRGRGRRWGLEGEGKEKEKEKEKEIARDRIREFTFPWCLDKPDNGA